MLKTLRQHPSPRPGGQALSSALQRSVGVLILLVAVLLAPVLLPDFRLYSLITAATTLVVALGVNIQFGFVGMFNIAHGAFALLGAYTVAICMSRWDMPFLVALAIAILVAAVVGVVTAAPALRFGTLAVAIATMLYLGVLEEIILYFPDFTGGSAGVSSPRSGFGLPVLWYFMAGGAAVAWVLTRNLLLGPAGRSMKLTSQSSELAQSLRISVTRVRLSAVTLGAVAAAAAGGTWPLINGYTDTHTYPLFFSILVVAMVVVGGEGSLLGPVVGVAIFTALNEFLSETFQQGGQVSTLVYGTALVIVAILLPRGVVGTVSDIGSRRRQEGRPDADSRNGTGSGALPDLLTALRSAQRPPNDQVALSLHDVSVSFGGVHALSEVSMKVYAGTVHGLIGPNGAGKTTLLNCISGFRPLTAGEMQIWTEPLQGAPFRRARRGLCRTFQTPVLLEHASAVENVLVGVDATQRAPYMSYVLRTKAARRQARLSIDVAHQWLDVVGYDGSLTAEASQLSPGQRRQVEIARAMATSADILLMDEPAAGLTDDEVALLGKLLRELASSGTTVVLIDHHAEFVLSVSDTLTVLDAGRVIADGLPAKVREDPAVVAAYLGDDLDIAIDELVENGESTGLHETGVTHERR